MNQADAFASVMRNALKAFARTVLPAGRNPGIGARVRLVAPITELVYADLRRHSARQNTTVSRFCADLLASTTGYHGLARTTLPKQLDLEGTPHAVVAPAGPIRDLGTRIRTEIYLHKLVDAQIRYYATKYGTAAEHLAADLLALATGYPGLIRHRDPVNAIRRATVQAPAISGGLQAELAGRCIG